MERRGFGIRAVAVILDAIFVAVISYTLSLVFGATLGAVVGGLLGGPAGGVAGGAAGAFYLTGSLAVLLTFLYGLIEAFTGASPAKRLLKMRIMNADSTEAATGTLFFRYLLKNSATALTILASLTGLTFLADLGGIAGMIIVLGFFLTLTASKQGVHDRIAKTAVYGT